MTVAATDAAGSLSYVYYVYGPDTLKNLARNSGASLVVNECSNTGNIPSQVQTSAAALGATVCSNPRPFATLTVGGVTTTLRSRFTFEGQLRLPDNTVVAEAVVSNTASNNLYCTTANCLNIVGSC